MSKRIKDWNTARSVNSKKISTKKRMKKGELRYAV